MPYGPRLRLQYKLLKVNAIGPQLNGFEEFDSAFDFQSQNDQISSIKWENFPTFDIRDSFMVLHNQILKQAQLIIFILLINQSVMRS